MRFPARELSVNPHGPELRGEPAEDAGIDVEPLAPLTVRTGRHARLEVLITNRTGRTEVLFSNGALSSVVTDGSGSVVGRFVVPPGQWTLVASEEPGLSHRMQGSLLVYQ